MRGVQREGRNKTRRQFACVVILRRRVGETGKLGAYSTGPSLKLVSMSCTRPLTPSLPDILARPCGCVSAFFFSYFSSVNLRVFVPGTERRSTTGCQGASRTRLRPWTTSVRRRRRRPGAGDPRGESCPPLVVSTPSSSTVAVWATVS